MKKAILILCILFLSYPLFSDIKTQLFNAIEKNDIESVKDLINKGADVNTANDYDPTALM